MTPSPIVPVRKFVADAAERVGWTFLETFAGAAAIAAMTGKLTLPAVYAAAIAGAAAALAMVKAFAASRLGKTGTASTLPAELDPANHPAPPPIVVTAYAPPETSSEAAALDAALRADGLPGLPSSPANTDDAQADPGDAGVDVMFTPPSSPVTEPTPMPVELAPDRPPVEALGHVDPPEVPPAPTALGARAEREKAAAEVRAAKAKTPAKKAAPAKRPARKATPASSTAPASAARKKAAAKKASSTRKRSR